MSADNYTSCPKCTKTTERKIEGQKNKIRTNYGKVSEKEYLSLQRKLKVLEAHLRVDATLREDYEIGIRDGIFEIHYSCHCRACDYSYSYTYNKEVIDNL